MSYTSHIQNSSTSPLSPSSHLIHVTNQKRERSKGREERRKEQKKKKKKKKGRRGEEEDGAHPLLLEDAGDLLHHLLDLDVPGVGGDAAPSTFFFLTFMEDAPS